MITVGFGQRLRAAVHDPCPRRGGISFRSDPGPFNDTFLLHGFGGLPNPYLPDIILGICRIEIKWIIPQKNRILRFFCPITTLKKVVWIFFLASLLKYSYNFIESALNRRLSVRVTSVVLSSPCVPQIPTDWKRNEKRKQENEKSVAVQLVLPLPPPGMMCWCNCTWWCKRLTRHSARPA